MGTVTLKNTFEREVDKQNHNRHSHCKTRFSFPSKSWVGQTPSIIVINSTLKLRRIFDVEDHEDLEISVGHLVPPDERRLVQLSQPENFEQHRLSGVVHLIVDDSRLACGRNRSANYLPAEHARFHAGGFTYVISVKLLLLSAGSQSPNFVSQGCKMADPSLCRLLQHALWVDVNQLQLFE